jgi:hypothetical protein
MSPEIFSRYSFGLVLFGYIEHICELSLIDPFMQKGNKEYL